MENCLLWGEGLPKERIRRLNSLHLAYIGDTVYDLYVRGSLLSASDAPVRDLHKAATLRVRATAQAGALGRVLPLLGEEEADIVRRGRNAGVHSMPKHASPSEYHMATALEALVGYLYLTGQWDRLNEIMSAALREEHS